MNLCVSPVGLSVCLSVSWSFCLYICLNTPTKVRRTCTLLSRHCRRINLHPPAQKIRKLEKSKKMEICKICKNTKTYGKTFKNINRMLKIHGKCVNASKYIIFIILHVFLCPDLYFKCLDQFFCICSCFMLRTYPKRRTPKKHNFWRYSDLQIFYQDPFGEQNDGWSEPPQGQSN